MDSPAEMNKLPTHQRWRLHPATMLLLWVALAILAQALQGGLLLLLAASSSLLALLWSGRRLLILLRRTRWILLSLVLLYAYVTPGEPLFEQWGVMSPVREGLSEGGLQLVRLLTVLAGLSILLGRLSREQLITALHTLLYPLQYLGGSRERIAVRLALTLHYAERQLQEGSVDRHVIRQWLDFVPVDGSEVVLHGQSLDWRDWLVLAMVAALVTGVLW
ncbi:MAG TPA: CbiQ family ECF transporter T component [Gallionellaceae bacterium]|nr:CbiQ family ECF transporter T component [Gallionellaceae bacterium]